MAKDAIINVRTDARLKNEVEAIFHHLGLTSTAAINMFYQQVKLNYGMPFPVRIPTALTLKTVRDADKGIDVIESKSVDELFDKFES